MTPDDLIREIEMADTANASLHVMLDVAGRWTNVKGVRVDEAAGILFIESED
jgi:hypothetical protein